jgi:hypothetical protein
MVDDELRVRASRAPMTAIFRRFSGYREGSKVRERDSKLEGQRAREKGTEPEPAALPTGPPMAVLGHGVKEEEALGSWARVVSRGD